VVLEPRSLLVFEDEAYHNWYHSIEAAHQDTVHARRRARRRCAWRAAASANAAARAARQVASETANLHLLGPTRAAGAVLPRGTRLSLTFRQVRARRAAERVFATPAVADARRRAASQFDDAIFDRGAAPR